MSPLLESFPDDLPPPIARWFLNPTLSPAEQAPPLFLGPVAGDFSRSLDPCERRHPRVTTCVPVRFRAESSSGASDAVLGNLSKGGLFIRTLEAFAPGTIIAGGFVVAGKKSFVVKFRGVVCWLTPPEMSYPPGPGIGVRFCRVFEEIVDNRAPAQSQQALKPYRLCAAIGASSH